MIDADKEFCENISMMMKEVDVQISAVQRLGEARDLIQNTDIEGRPYQLILLDCNMPDMDNTHTVQALQKAAADRIPILLLAEHSGDDLEDALFLENVHILAKPFFISALKEKIMEMQNSSAMGDKTETENDNSLEGLRFLAAEDNEINAEILAEILQMEGAGCEIVENGRLAVERFACAAEGEFDAILMDVQMPVMNGYEATLAIRALNRSDAGQIPIIAMTANAFAEDEKAALDAGMNAHVAKPLDMEQFKKVIRECIKL